MLDSNVSVKLESRMSVVGILLIGCILCLAYVMHVANVIIGIVIDVINTAVK